MSKKKNTLKDLDEFLKQQAATLVSPQRLGGKAAIPEPLPESTKEKNEEIRPVSTEPSSNKVVTRASVIKDLKQLTVLNGSELTEEICEVVLSSLEQKTDFTPEEKMLINTALYIKHGSTWQEAIRAFWKNKKS
jgi:hypothetical protein